MDEYCRFCAGKQDNLSNIFSLEKGVCDWFIEEINRGLEHSLDVESLPQKVCYSCLCRIEDINWFLEDCRSSVLQLKTIWKNKIATQSEKKAALVEEFSINFNEEELELEYLEISDEDTILKSLTNEEISDYSESTDIENTKLKNFDDNTKFESNTYTKNSKYLNNLPANNKNSRSYLCTKCGVSFNDRQNFTYHMKKHVNGNNYVCDFCSKSFLTKYQLTSHKWIHTGAGFENHECEQCGKKCRSSYELEIHMRFHTQLRLYQCDICSKSFILKVHLKQHMVTHTGERNYVCNAPGCNKSYTTTSSLKKHKDIHLTDSEKHISCEYCSRKFSMPFILRDHMRKSHRKLLTESIKQLC